MNRTSPHNSPTVFSYAVGYFLSLACTLLVFGMAYTYMQGAAAMTSYQTIASTIVVLALVQLALQAVLFLHLSKSARYNMLAFIFTLYTVSFIVIGSLWIMHNLHENMTPEQMSAYMHMQD